MTAPTNAKGEVIDAVTISQFYPGKTEFACGFYAAGMIRYAGRPGAGPAGTSIQVEAWADMQYLKEYGEDGANQLGGVSIDDEHRLLKDALPQSAPFHYQDLDISPGSSQVQDMEQVRGALSSGYPLVATVTEVSIFDKELGRNPYFWGAAGTHVLVITGRTPEGDLLVHDSANVSGSLQGPNTPLPSPRTYDGTRIALQWATMCRMSWLAPFPEKWNPLTGSSLNGLPDTFNEMVVALWQLTGEIYPRGTGIFAAWRNDLISGLFRGHPLSAETPSVDRQGNSVIYQAFSKYTCLWQNGKAIWM